MVICAYRASFLPIFRRSSVLEIRYDRYNREPIHSDGVINGSASVLGLVTGHVPSNREPFRAVLAPAFTLGFVGVPSMGHGVVLHTIYSIKDTS